VQYSEFVPTPSPGRDGPSGLHLIGLAALVAARPAKGA